MPAPPTPRPAATSSAPRPPPIPPRWALDALGPVPTQDEDVTARLEWERRAGWAAAWRELAGHTDENDPLGRAPARGLVEKAALFRKAHEELRLLDVGAEEADMSDGRLRARVRAMQLEDERAPADVADQLAVAHELADKARVDATVWAARADAAASPDREQLQAAAEEASRTAVELTDRITGLEAADEARGEWYLDSVVTRDYAHRSASELRARSIDPYDTSDHVTGDEWLDAHRDAQADDDQHREIHPDDLIDDHDDTHTDVPEPRDREPIREVDQTAEMVPQAQETLRMIEQRRAAEAEQAAHEASRAAEEGRAAQLTQWAQEDEQTATDTATVEVDDGRALER
ncbi:MAG: hypothetical protein ACRDRK_05460 [Pseudonocardia sp.]